MKRHSGVLKWLLLILGGVVLVLLATRNIGRDPTATPDAPSPPVGEPPWPASDPRCNRPEAYRNAASANRASLADGVLAPFGVAEQGWDAYAPVIGRDIGATCGPGTPAFAAALARWQQANGLPGHGRVDPPTLEKMRVTWMLARPFVLATRDGGCPASISESRLAAVAAEEGYHGQRAWLRPGALAAYRRLVAAARRENPQAFVGDPQLLTIVSGYRSTATNTARCADGGCGGPARARCSAHGTGLAIDLNVGAVNGQGPADATDENRSFQARTPLYGWLVRNAGRFGFVGYPYEPWHWEWTGEPVAG